MIRTLIFFILIHHYDTTKRIGATGELTSSFYLSRNELRFLKEHRKVTFIYKVKIVPHKNEETLLQVFPVDEVLKSKVIIPTQYFVRIGDA